MSNQMIKDFFNKILTYTADTTRYLNECDILLFCHDADRGVSLSGKAYSPLVDSIKEDLERMQLTCQVIAHPFSILTDGKATGNPIAINRKYVFWGLLKKTLPTFFKVNKIYEFIFKKTKAKLIITIGCNDDLSSTARRLGVFHVELLHGIGYSFIPWDWDQKKRKTLPQGILALDKKSEKTFYPLTQFGIEIKTIPHPFLKRFHGKYLHTLPDEWSIYEKNSKAYKKNILICLEWGYAGDHGAYEFLANILENGLFFPEIEGVVAKRKDIFWHFRFHPVQMRAEKYKHLLKYMDEFCDKYRNTEWRIASTIPLPAIAKQCNGSIGMSSMSCYDNASVGLCSLMLSPALMPGQAFSNYFEDLVDEGYVIKGYKKLDHIEEWADSVKKIAPRLSNLENERAWDDALQWMLKESGLAANVKMN